MSVFVLFSALFALVFLLSTPLASAFSSGNMPYCDLGTSKPYGTGSLMNWVVPPRASSLFTLRSGDGPDPSKDPITYTSGVPIPIHLRTLDQYNRILGVELYAIRGTDTTASSDITNQVGSWQVTPNTNFQVISPPGGGTCVVHSNAQLKLLHNVFYFTAPPGSGTVTFRILIKIGEQNTGFFVYPTKTLTLLEGFPVELESPTVQAFANESCSAACARAYSTSAKYCDRQRTAQLATSAQLNEAFVSTTCRTPYLVTCSKAAPLQDTTEGFCMMNRKGCSLESTTSCESTDALGQRFCYCTASVEKSQPSAAGAGGQSLASSSSTASSDFPILPIGIALACVVVIAVASLLAYGFWKRSLLERQVSKLMSLDVPMESVGSDGKRLHPTMPNGNEAWTAVGANKEATKV